MAVNAGTRLQHQCDDDSDDDEDDDDDDLLKSILSTEVCLFSTTTCFGCLQDPTHVVVLN